MTYPIRRIFFECTQIFDTRGTSGIPRVVRSLAESGPDAGNALGVEFVPVIVRGRHFLAARPQPASLDTRRSWGTVSVPRWMSKTYHRIARRLNRVFARSPLARQAQRSTPTLTITAGDILVLSGSVWTEATATAVQLARQAGARIGVIVYDLIPVDHPEFFSPQAAAVFQDWIGRVTRAADFYLSISNATRCRMQRFAVEQHPNRDWSAAQFRAFRLGSNIDTRPVGGRFQRSLRAAFKGEPGDRTYLTVATIEPRKNHAWLLDAWEEIWRTHTNLRWCVVGRIGWLCEDLVLRIRNHPLLGRNLFLFNDLSERELSYCYHHASAFLFGSKAEGFGLPIVEALSHGLPTFASEISVHREVGGDFCAYFDLASIDSLVSRIRAFEESRLLPGAKPLGGFRGVEWKASALEFVRETLAATDSSNESLPVAA